MLFLSVARIYMNTKNRFKLKSLNKRTYYYKLLVKFNILFLKIKNIFLFFLTKMISKKLVNLLFMFYTIKK